MSAVGSIHLNTLGVAYFTFLWLDTSVALLVKIVFAWVLFVVELDPSSCSTMSGRFGLARHVSGSNRRRRPRLGVPSWSLIRRCREGTGLTPILTFVGGGFLALHCAGILIIDGLHAILVVTVCWLLGCMPVVGGIVFDVW